MARGRVDYDQIAPSYDQRYGALQYEGVASTLLSLAPAGSAERILEVGCGTGHWLTEPQAVFPHVYGLDSSIRMLEQADQELRDRLVCGEAGHLPLSEAVFDLIFCVNAFHHFDRKQETLTRAAQALRSGGTLAMIGMDPHTGQDHWSLYHYFEGTREADLLQAEKMGVSLEFVVDISLALVTGRAPYS
ncbi:MAG: class I SAM-dependent methyltransferase [Anaerolineae bacterium]